MNSYRRILVVSTEACDPRPAFERALRLAREGEVELTLLDVAEPVPLSARALFPANVVAALESESVERRAAIVMPLAAEAQKAGIDAHTKMATGAPFRVAIQAALAGSYDLIVKAVDVGSERSRSTFGSTDKHLLRKCPCALWLVARDSGQALSRVLAAVNPDPADPEDHALSSDILSAATAAAALDGAELHVLHAWKTFGHHLMRGPQPVVSDPEVDYFVGQALARHSRFLKELLERVPSPMTTKPHLVHALPADAIIDFVQSQSPDLLVMGTVGRTGIPGLLIGNTAERVLSEVTCSVLALKPQGFVSPVALDS